MSCEESEDDFDIDDIDACLEKIENKYTSKPRADLSVKENDLDSCLKILSQDFDTLGLPLIDLKESPANILQQVVDTSHSLVNIHRKTLLQLKDLHINRQCGNVKNYDLEKKILQLNTDLERHKGKRSEWGNKINKLKTECSILTKKITEEQSEKRRIKRHCDAKCNDLISLVNQLKNENQHLKELCGKELGKSTDENVVKLLKKYKKKEDVYKEAILKLEQNNRELVEETVNLREDLALAYFGNKTD